MGVGLGLGLDESEVVGARPEHPSGLVDRDERCAEAEGEEGDDTRVVFEEVNQHEAVGALHALQHLAIAVRVRVRARARVRVRVRVRVSLSLSLSLTLTLTLTWWARCGRRRRSGAR